MTTPASPPAPVDYPAELRRLALRVRAGELPSVADAPLMQAAARVAEQRQHAGDREARHVVMQLRGLARELRAYGRWLDSRARTGHALEVCADRLEVPLEVALERSRKPLAG